MPKKICAVKNCFNSKLTSFYSFRNRRPDVLEMWLKFCDEDKTWSSDEIRNSKICSMHFVPDDFINFSVKSRGLKTFAIPTVKHNEIWHQNVYPDNAIEYSMEVEIDPASPTDKIPLNNKGAYRKLMPTVTKSDHNYAVSYDKQQELLRKNHEQGQLIIKYRELYRQQKQKAERRSKSIKRLKEKCNKLTKELKKQRKIDKQTTKPTPFLAEQLKNFKKKPKGMRYSAHTKNIALGLQFCSTKGYKQFQNVLKLPSISLLQKWISNVDIKEGINENIISLLKVKSKNLPKPERCVTLSVDEISLRENVNFLEKSSPTEIIGFPTILSDGSRDVNNGSKSALVLMIRCMQTGFKQSIGFYFSKSGFKASELLSIVKEGIKAIKRSGYITKLLVCDQNATNRALFKLLNVSIECPYFDFENERIFAMFDPPHLLKSSRNNLYKHNGIYMGAIIKWQHINDFYEADSKRTPRAIPDLREKHIILQPFAEMRVNYAKIVLSGKMSSGIRTYADLNVISKECVNTANYCKDMDDLFDIFNTSNDIMKKELRRPLRDDSIHWKKLNVIERRLKKLRFIPQKCESLKEESKIPALPKQSRNPWFVDGWLLNISCIRLLFKDLKNYGFTSLITKYLTQDALENFFGLIRMKGHNNRHPDPFLFRCCYRQVLMSQMLKLYSEGTNCEPDDGEVIVKPEDFSRIRFFREKNQEGLAVNLEETFYSPNGDIFDSAQITNVHFSAGWVLNQIGHPECLKKVQENSRISSKTKMLSTHRASHDSSSEVIVGKKFLDYLQFVVSTFKSTFLKLLTESNFGIRENIQKIIMNSKKGSDLLCAACENQVLVRFLNMLIRSELRQMNDRFKASAKENRNSAVARKAKNLNIVK